MSLKKFTAAVVIALICNTPSYATPRDVSHSTDAQTRMSYLDKLLQSRSGQRLAEHNNGKTKAEVDRLLEQANRAIEKGNDDKADQLAKQALKTIMQAIRELPEDPEEVARFKNRYTDMRHGLESLTYAQENNKERFANEAGNKEYDKQKVSSLMAKAKQDADKGDYQQAIVRLAEAQSIVTASLQGMLNNKRLIIELDISTPEKEYYYELRRYLGYEELIPVAIEVKKPSPIAEETMTKMHAKAQWMSDQARSKVIEGDYPVAIRMMMDATNVLKQALKLVGVYF